MSIYTSILNTYLRDGQSRAETADCHDLSTQHRFRLRIPAKGSLLPPRPPIGLVNMLERRLYKVRAVPFQQNKGSLFVVEATFQTLKSAEPGLSGDLRATLYEGASDPLTPRETRTRRIDFYWSSFGE